MIGSMYDEWARNLLKNYKPSEYTWQGMTLNEMSSRGLAITRAAQNLDRECNWADWSYNDEAVAHLESMMKFINKKYDWKYNNNTRRNWR